MFTRVGHWGRVIPSAVSIALQRCALLVLIAVVGVVAYTRVNPVAAQSVHDLDACAGLPCYRGITPGVTTWDQAMHMFDGRVVIQIDPPEWEIHLFQSANEETVGRVVVRLSSSDSLTLGDVVALFGAPCGVEYAAKARSALILYPRLVVKVAVTESRLMITAPVQQLWLRVADATMSCAGLHQNSDTISVRMAWRGFGRVEVQ